MWKVYLIALSVGLLGEAAGVVKLHNGVRLEVDRAEREGDAIWLHTRAGIQYVAAAEVVSIDEAGAEKKPGLLRFSRPDPRRAIPRAA